MTSQSRSTDKAASAKALAAAYLSHERFHQRFTLPATEDHENLTLSYADAGRQQNQSDDVPAVLFMPGMFASRCKGSQGSWMLLANWLIVSVLWMHAIAEKLCVRVIVVDR